MSFESASKSTVENDVPFEIECSAYLTMLEGVAVATKTSEEDEKLVARWILSYETQHSSSTSELTHEDHVSNTRSFNAWRTSIASHFSEQDENSRQLANLALAITFVREKCRQGQNINATALAVVWNSIYGALASPRLTRPFGCTNNSAKGLFLIVPLCSLVEDGYIKELFRLHVWLPNHPRPIPEFAIHAHQAFAQSWILAGKGIDHSYKAELVADPTVATHAEYSNEWSKGKAYRTDTQTAKIWNTGDLVTVTETNVAAHTRDMTYTIAAGAYHMSEVPSDILHATLFFFDSRREFVKDARVLGPKDGDSFSHTRDPTISHSLPDSASVTPTALAQLVETIRSWEMLKWKGQQHSQKNEIEQALQALNSALGLCESVENFPNVNWYKHVTVAELHEIRKI